MQTLKEKIEECEYEIHMREVAILAYKRCLNDLKLQRSKCHHVFTQAPAGLEHEGGQCTLCGINEVYAASQKIGAQYENR